MAVKGTQFVFYKYIDPRTKKEVTGDMPKHDWERIQRDSQRKPHFFLIREVDLSAPTIAAANIAAHGSTGKVVAEVIEDELECPLCGYVAKNDEGLQKHKTKKHA